MSTTSTKVRVAAFVLALAAAFGGAYGIGAAVGPLPASSGGAEEPHEPGHGTDGVMR
ncbi:hypothetical protein [Streptomyces liangshanensis]|uniref:Uncharacterized protein n=1 Tax=Streptomyces liangshanensis TaxID=2717324 RepID=A0A6G9H0X7_9ACTN|nr:hypothetical protein [Streptomyces liangshanensis]QIQ04192.1 hypothetical protein HA039_19445 [Streptomyces liangshanensis]